MENSIRKKLAIWLLAVMALALFQGLSYAQTLINGAGLRDWDKDGLLEQDTDPGNMWRGSCASNLCLEFELPEPVALGAVEVWNYNADWQTGDGMRKADVAVSSDGTTWDTVLRGAEFARQATNYFLLPNCSRTNFNQMCIK